VVPPLPSLVSRHLGTAFRTDTLRRRWRLAGSCRELPLDAAIAACRRGYNAMPASASGNFR
jgi:hypothetical protein